LFKISPNLGEICLWGDCKICHPDKVAQGDKVTFNYTILRE